MTIFHARWAFTIWTLLSLIFQSFWIGGLYAFPQQGCFYAGKCSKGNGYDLEVRVPDALGYLTSHSQGGKWPWSLVLDRKAIENKVTLFDCSRNEFYGAKTISRIVLPQAPGFMPFRFECDFGTCTLVFVGVTRDNGWTKPCGVYMIIEDQITLPSYTLENCSKLGLGIVGNC